MYCVSKAVQTDPSDDTIEEIILPDKDPEDGVQKTIALEPPSVDEPFNELSTYDPNISVTNVETECKICELRFEKRSDLKKHELLNHCEETYDCDICQRLFKTKQHYLQHISIKHTSENPFKCERCDRGFKTRVSLRRHNFREHGEGVPFECDECDQLFVLKYELKRHKINCHKEGPFRCHICQKTFKLKSHLENHYEKHSHVQKRAECDACHLEFLTLEHLNYHKESVHFWGGIKPSLEQPKEISQRNLFTLEPDQYQLIYYEDLQPDTYSTDQNVPVLINQLEEAEVSEEMEELNDNNFGFKISDGFQLTSEIELEDLPNETNPSDDPNLNQMEELEDDANELELPTETNPLHDPNFNQMEQLDDDANESDLPTEIEELQSELPSETDQFVDPNFKLELRNEMDELGNYQNEPELPAEMGNFDFAIESNLPTEVDRFEETNSTKIIDVDEKRDENLGTNKQISDKLDFIAKKLVPQQSITRRDEVTLQMDLKDKGNNSDVGYKGHEFNPSLSSEIRDENLGSQIVDKPGIIAKKCKKCNKWFTDLSRLRNHLKYSSKCKPDINPNDSSKHNLSHKTLNSSSQLFKRRQNLVNNNCVKSFSCYSCERSFENPINLQKHREEVHTVVRSYKCKHCVSYFQSKRRLNVHVERYCGWTKFYSNFGCQSCQVFFSDEITFQNHKKVHGNCFVRVKKLIQAEKDPKIISVNKRGAKKVVRKKRKRN